MLFKIYWMILWLLKQRCLSALLTNFWPTAFRSAKQQRHVREEQHFSAGVSGIDGSLSKTKAWGYISYIYWIPACMIPCHVGTCQRPKYAVKHTTPSSFRDLDFFKHHLSPWNHRNVFILKRIYPYPYIYIIIDTISSPRHHDVGKMNNYCKNKIKLITHFSRYSNLLEKQFRMVFTVF